MYYGPSLAALFDLDNEVREICHALADRGGEEMTRNTREFTPVGSRPFEPGYVPGHLLESISQKLVVVTVDLTGRLVYESGAKTNVEYAIYVEEGTGLWGPYRRMYEIRPKNPDGWLRFLDEHGNPVFAKRVMHPGSPGAHMFARGAAKTEVEMHEWAQRMVDEWSLRVGVVAVLKAKSRVIVSA